jgi:hypothetical protein
MRRKGVIIIVVAIIIIIINGYKGTQYEDRSTKLRTKGVASRLSDLVQLTLGGVADILPATVGPAARVKIPSPDIQPTTKVPS